MPKLIIQADDYAITPAVTEGILEAARRGTVGATGVFTNRPAAPRAIQGLNDLPSVDLGLDLNFVTGSPLLESESVPSLVEPTGQFRSSRTIVASHRIAARDGVFVEFESEPFPYEETVAEARAQYERFVELAGKKPAYLHHHSLVTPMLDRVLHELGEDEDVLVMDDLLRSPAVWWVPNKWYGSPLGVGHQAESNAVAAVASVLDEIAERELSILITHPGYVDAELLDISSFNVVRARDLEALIDPDLRGALDARGIELTTYSREGLVQ